MGRFDKGPIPAEMGLPVATTWDEFEPDQPTEPDGDDSVHWEEMKHLIPPEKIEAHRRERR